MPANTAPVFTAGTGKVVTPIGASYDYGNSVALQADGKIVLGGISGNGANDDFALVRYNADGSLDTSFDTDGKVVTPIGASYDEGYSVALQADGKIVLGGYTYNGTNYDFALARYNADGSLDTGFGTDGKALTPIGASTDEGNSVALQADGKIVVGGYTYNGANDDFALIRYNANGSLDSTFGTDGKVVTPIGASDDEGRSVALQADGKIVLGGYIYNGANYDFALVRYNANGSLDTSFDTDGKVVTPIASYDYGNSVALQADGKIVLGGYTYNGASYDFALVRYNADGSLDTSFDTDGKVVTPIGVSSDYSYSVALQADGKIVMGGYTDNGVNYDFALTRYNTDGSLDTGFGTGGKVVTPVGISSDYSYSVALQADGKIVLGGYAYNGSNTDVALVRYNADGSLDTSFSTSRFTENGAAVAVDDGVSLYDNDLSSLGNYSGASVTLARSTGANTQDVFGASGTLFSLAQGDALFVDGVKIGTVDVNKDGFLALSFNSSATGALIQSALRQITYANTSDTPPEEVALKWTFSDGNTGAQGTGGALTASDTSTVLIASANDAPVITSNGGAESATVKVAENGKAVAVLNATDVDSGAFQWSIGGGADAKFFTIDAGTGALSFKSAPDFEAPKDSGKNNVYNVVVQVSDGTSSDSQALAVKVSNVKGVAKTGSSKANTLKGSSEEDTLDGKAGKDTLTGKGGRDTFVFSTALGSKNVDEITDFSHRDDRIKLDRDFFKGLAKGGLDDDAFHLGTKSGDGQDRVLYDKKHGDLYFDADGTKKHGVDPVKFAHLDKIGGAFPTLDHTDFFGF